MDVERFARVLARTPSVADRVFTAGERDVVGVERLAARFAAKEAVMKALGVGIGGFAWRDVEVVRGPGGAPSLALRGAAAALADARGVTSWLISLTHTATSAVAVVAAL